MKPCVGLITLTQILTALGIAYGAIPAGPPTTAAILALFLLLHAIMWSGIAR